MGKKEPKYVELVNWIRSKIENRELLAGEKLYSENELSEMFHLSRQTVRHAISILDNEGILRRVQGSGTYINDNRQLTIENNTKIAVVTTYVDDYIFPRTIQGIENVLYENGYSVQISFTNNQQEQERAILEDVLSKDEVAGMIIEPTKSALPNCNKHLYEKLQEKKIPILFINCYYRELKLPHVSLNDKKTAQKAVEYLIEAGHKKIGGIFKLDDWQGHLRYNGYLEAMRSAKLSVSEDIIVWIDTKDVKKLEKEKDKIIERLQDCTAVICYNDEVSFSLVEILTREGIRVPEDLSVISVDNSDLAVLGDVAITSVPHPMEKLGEKAAMNLMKLIKNPTFDAGYEFETDIIERGSVMKIKQ